jgi:hypothetical protein
VPNETDEDVEITSSSSFFFSFFGLLGALKTTLVLVSLMEPIILAMKLGLLGLSSFVFFVSVAASAYRANEPR